MQVLKFGGTSVGNADHIRKVIEIVRKKVAVDKTIVVVSAMSGTTDALIHCGELASSGNEEYKDKLLDIEHRHLNTAKQLLPVQQQSAILSQVKKMCNELEDICNGIFLLGELSARTKDRIMSYGELISSQMITAAFRASDIPTHWKDSREIICTNSDFGHAIVDFSATNERVKNCLGEIKESLIIVPGFIASDHKGITTTLGRGGSDYTAAILAAASNARELGDLDRCFRHDDCRSTMGAECQGDPFDILPGRHGAFSFWS